ncbi:ankyrin repeat-containing protein [Talaromyces pinophilus]|uniref:Ankyrin repeat-containing protein n=1 Tax=Talaromyces pinophilus TaxID=128442 RepID=A0A478EBI8_TALPI|nr:ankyrin repeat-containing protein [Talaromyces pinophilus]
MEEIHETWAPPIWAPETLNYRKFFNASVSGDMQAMQEALASGEINVNACPKWEDWEGDTALHRAAECGHLELVQLLISHGAEVDRRDYSPLGPKTALHLAAHQGHVAIVKELLHNGADVNTRGQMGGPLLNFVLWLKRSISDKEYKVIDLVLSQGRYNIHSWLMEMGGTILHQAAEIGDLTLIQFLVDHGADCNYVAPTYEGYTVLRSAVVSNQTEACRLLIDLGAYVTPSAFAQASCMDMVELLRPHLSQLDISTSGILNHASKPGFARGCDQQLQDARDKVNSPDYVQGLTDLINAVKSKMDDPSNRIYWVGYNKFFDTRTRDCDDVTWAIPRLGSYQYLTLERRQAMNDLVDLVHEKIKAVVQAAGSQVVFVDWQADTDTLGGRYCEPGVDEHWDYSKHIGASMEREETVFYEWGTTKDNNLPGESDHDKLKRRQDITAPLNTQAANDTFEGAIANYVQQGILDDPDSYKALPDDGTYNITSSFLPDKYGRVFHPTKYGHSIIAKNIMNAITEEQAKIMNQPAVTTTLGCPIGLATTTAVPTPTVSPTNNCNGKNVGSAFDSLMLQILPLSGSITWGQQSPSGNGYRKYLRNALVDDGANVNVVGTIKHGTMDDNDNEGWPGFRVDQISDRANNALSMFPNLILINASTNDVAQNYNINSIDQTMEDLVNKLLDNISGTVVIVSTLLVNRNATKQALTEQVNPKYVNLVEKLAAQGKLVYLADMSSITTEMINARDGTHPTDYGYEVMANLCSRVGTERF